MQVLVRDNNVDQALRVLKKKMQREGIFREMKQRKAYEKPSERKAREKADAIRRARKQARKPAMVWSPPPSPSPASATARVGPECRPAVDPVRKAEVRSGALGGRALSDVPRACMLLTSTFGRTTGPRRYALPGARSDYLSR